MKDAINYGDSPVDMHSILGSFLMSIDKQKEITYEEFVLHKKEPGYKEYRSMAKPINLGYPGGIGPAKMVMLAKDDHNVEITLAHAKELKSKFFDLYPELDWLLNRDLNQLKTGNKITYKDGNSSPEYSYSVLGMRRRGCSYNAACNGLLMQTPAALGTKIMLWNLLKETKDDSNIELLAFIHDEVLFEIKDNDSMKDNVEKVSYIMVDSMKKILPDVRVSVEADVGYIWKKEGLGVFSKTYWRD
jgi:DNA polymerase I-like protein with 3'-5' exonuclease and polymerase domains